MTIAITEPTVTEHEAAQVERANASTATCRPQKLALRVSFPLVTEQSGARWHFSKGVFVVQAT